MLQLLSRIECRNFKKCHNCLFFYQLFVFLFSFFALSHTHSLSLPVCVCLLEVVQRQIFSLKLQTGSEIDVEDIAIQATILEKVNKQSNPSVYKILQVISCNLGINLCSTRIKEKSKYMSQFLDDLYIRSYVDLIILIGCVLWKFSFGNEILKWIKHSSRLQGQGVCHCAATKHWWLYWHQSGGILMLKVSESSRLIWLPVWLAKLAMWPTVCAKHHGTVETCGWI